MKKYAYNQTGCIASNQCANNTNMVCVGSTCTCLYPNSWNGTYCGKIAFKLVFSLELAIRKDDKIFLEIKNIFSIYNVIWPISD